MTSIRSIACALPDTEVTNAELGRRNPAWGIDLVAELSGVESRRFAADDETAFDLSLRACEELFARSDATASDIDAILYCTHDADYPMPGNAHLLHSRLGLGDDVLAFDYRLACSGFVYGVGFADAFARAGLASAILLVTAETQSKRINPRDRSLTALLGDGAAATYISVEDGEGARVVASELCTHGQRFEDVFTPAGGARAPSGEETRRETTDANGNVRTAEDVHMDGVKAWAFIGSIVPGHIESFLARQSIGWDEIDLCVFHQASKMVLDSLERALAIPPEKLFRHIKDVGNLSSASIPFALRAALDQGAIRDGDRVLVSGFGAGISYGSAILEF